MQHAKCVTLKQIPSIILIGILLFGIFWADVMIDRIMNAQFQKLDFFAMLIMLITAFFQVPVQRLVMQMVVLYACQ